MKSNPRFKAKHVLSLCLAVAGGLAMSAHAQTAEELIAKNTEARGGIEKIKAITSLRSTGKLEEGGIVILLQQDQKMENLLRQSATIQGMTQVQAFDGADGWQIDPFGGRRDPERMG